MSALTSQRAFDVAVRHHQAGRLQEAEVCYLQVLAQEPQHAAALHGLGVVVHDSGRSALAVDLISRAVALRSDSAEAHNSLAFVLRSIGEHQRSIDACNRAIALQPDLPEAHNNLGVALAITSRLDEAIAGFQRAIALRPRYAEAHSNLGNALKEKGELDRAIIAYRQAIAICPNHAEAYYNLGTTLSDNGRFDDAITCLQQAIALRPMCAEAHHNLSIALREKGRIHEAVAAARRAIELRPDLPEAHNHLGVAMRINGQLQESKAACHQAIALRPDFPEALNDLGNTLIELGEVDQAINVYRRAIVIKNDFAPAHNNLAMTLLSRGDFAAGWEEYEWRRKCRTYAAMLVNCRQPQWDGSPLHDKTILVHAEQGLGDTIHFVRYLLPLAERGARVLFLGDQRLKRLLRGTHGIAQWCDSDRSPPSFDFHCPLLSLPRAFQTTPQSIPAKIPYIFTESRSDQSWCGRLPVDRRLLRIGLVWAGSATHPNDRNRSMPLSELVSLLRLSDALFFSLQKDEAAAQIDALPRNITLTDCSDQLADFADTASLIANLDLVITVDTAAAHLAGAMGKPVWVLLPFACDWRWMLHRSDSPWYPTMRLFRQRVCGNWRDVISEVGNALSQLIDDHQKHPGNVPES